MKNSQSQPERTGLDCNNTLDNKERAPAPCPTPTESGKPELSSPAAHSFFRVPGQPWTQFLQRLFQSSHSSQVPFPTPTLFTLNRWPHSMCHRRKRVRQEGRSTTIASVSSCLVWNTSHLHTPLSWRERALTLPQHTTVPRSGKKGLENPLWCNQELNPWF